MRNPVSFGLGASGGSRSPDASELLSLQSRPDRVGDSYRYALETEVREKSSRGGSARRGRQEVLLEIVESAPKGRLIARTLVAIGADPGLRDHTTPYDRAWVGVRVIFETDARGAPLRVHNWPEARTQMFANLRREAPGPSPERAEVEAFMEEVSADGAVDLVGADLAALAGARSSDPVLAGRRELPSERFVRADGRRVKLLHTEENHAAGPGRVSCERTSRTDDDRQLVRTTATICTETGWPLEVQSEQAEYLPEAGYEHVRITRARRLDLPAAETA